MSEEPTSIPARHLANSDQAPAHSIAGMVAEGVPFSDVLGMRSPIRVCGEEGDIKAASAMHYTRAGQWSCFRTGTTMAPIDTCAAGGGQRQGKWDKGGGRGPHTHQGCQSPIELVVGVSMGTGVGYGSAKWRFSAGEGGRPSLLQGLGKGPTGKVRIGRSVWLLCLHSGVQKSACGCLFTLVQCADPSSKA